MKRIIYTVLFVIGIIAAIGTVGAADMERVTFTHLLVMSCISSLMIFIGGFGLNLEEERDEHRR